MADAAWPLFQQVPGWVVGAPFKGAPPSYAAGKVAKLPKTTDTSYVVPDVLELVYERIFDYE